MKKKLADPDPMKNTIVSKDIKIGFDALSNMNMLIIGGSGSGKTTGIVIPNILLGNCTNVILDIKGDLSGQMGAAFTCSPCLNMNGWNPAEKGGRHP